MAEQKLDSSHTQSGSAYRVEARCVNRPIVYDADELIGQNWTPLRTIKVPSPFGAAALRPEDELTNTLSFYGAVALAASFMSHHQGHYGLECRLIEYKRVITHTLERTGEESLLDEVRSAFAIAAASREEHG